MKIKMHKESSGYILLIIDQHCEFRDALHQYLKNNLSGFEIIEAKTAEEGIRIAKKQKPDIVLMDLQIPYMNGIIASETIKKAVPHCKIIVLSLFAGDLRRQNNISTAIDEVVGKNEIEIKLLPMLKKYVEDRCCITC